MKRRTVLLGLGAVPVVATVEAVAGDGSAAAPIFRGGEKPRLKTIEEHNAERKDWYRLVTQPRPLGIVCPEEGCDGELVNPKPNLVLTSIPRQQHAECPVCGWRGFVRL